MEFLSDDWLDALDAAARARVAAADDPLAAITVAVEQRVTDGPTWRLVIDHGAVSVVVVDDDDTSEPDVRLTCDLATASAIASGELAALQAFIAGDLVLGGDVRMLLDNRVALEAMGDLFATVRSETRFD